MQLSPSDLQTIRSQPQEFNLFLNIYQPETLFAAQVAGNVSQNARDIPYGASRLEVHLPFQITSS